MGRQRDPDSTDLTDRGVSNFLPRLVGLSRGHAMEEPPITRSSLLGRLRDSRDERAWAEFVEVYGPLIHRLARKRGLQEADASDLAQEVYRAVARAIERGDYDPEKGSFRGWLFRIARNLMINLMIRQGRHPKGTGDSEMGALLEAQPAPHPEESALIDSEYKLRLLQWATGRVRGEFSETTWAAFWRAGVEGGRAKEVAEALGMTPGAVYRCKSRVMARIREEIAGVEGETDHDTGGRGR
jgi:RNA polymerase sigma factor (sigma-70 family)